jgi:hypothetical protein
MNFDASMPVIRELIIGFHHHLPDRDELERGGEGTRPDSKSSQADDMPLWEPRCYAGWKLTCLMQHVPVAARRYLPILFLAGSLVSPKEPTLAERRRWYRQTDVEETSQSGNWFLLHPRYMPLWSDYRIQTDIIICNASVNMQL